MRSLIKVPQKVFRRTSFNSDLNFPQTQFVFTFSTNNKDEDVSQSNSQTPTNPKESELQWAWVPPRTRTETYNVKETYQIPVLKNKLISTEEVKKYLEMNGATEVVQVDLKEPLVNIKSMIMASATSPRLIRQLAEKIVDNMKEREIFELYKLQGIEGDRNDDWQLIDCHEFLVHLMLPDTRRQLNLEEHWSMDERPCLPFYKNEKEYDRAFNDLLDKYPAPVDSKYGDDDYDDAPQTVKVL